MILHPVFERGICETEHHTSVANKKQTLNPYVPSESFFTLYITKVESFYLEVNSPHFFAWMSKGHPSTWTCIGKRKTKAMVCQMIHYFLIVFQNSWLHTFILASLWGFFGKSTAAVLHPAALVSKSPGSFRLLEWFQSWRMWLWTSLWKCLYATHWELSWRLAGSGEANMAYTWNKF